jgi:hypothetical protein
MNEWKKFPEDKNLVVDDKEYMVSWKYKDENYSSKFIADGKLEMEISKYSSPVRAWWCGHEEKFFPLESVIAFPIFVDAFIELPEVPKDL